MLVFSTVASKCMASSGASKERSAAGLQGWATRTEHVLKPLVFLDCIRKQSALVSKCLFQSTFVCPDFIVGGLVF